MRHRSRVQFQRAPLAGIARPRQPHDLTFLTWASVFAAQDETARPGCDIHTKNLESEAPQIFQGTAGRRRDSSLMTQPAR